MNKLTEAWDNKENTIIFNHLRETASGTTQRKKCFPTALFALCYAPQYRAESQCLASEQLTEEPVVPQANTLAIRCEDGMAEFERHLRQRDLGRQILALPTNIRGGGSLGRSVGLAQLVVTWAQRSPSPEVKMYIKSGGNYPSFIERLYGFAAAYFAHSVTTRGNNDNIRMDLMHCCVPRIQAMSRGTLANTAKGRKVEFILAHHAKNQFHPTLYKRTPTEAELLDRERHGELITDPYAMADLLGRYADTYGFAHTPELAYLKHLLHHQDNPLGHLLYESFRNTAEHAYLDTNGQIPLRGLRSITIATHHVVRDDLASSTVLGSDHPHSATYFRQLKELRNPRYPAKKYIDILEISVLDSGPGFARTISMKSRDDETPKDDVALVAQCFNRHRSAKYGPASGIGLSRILEHIHKLKGFMRVRTSTTESFFAGGADYDLTMAPSNFVRGGLAPIRGTSITFGIPIVY